MGESEVPTKSKSIFKEVHIPKLEVILTNKLKKCPRNHKEVSYIFT